MAYGGDTWQPLDKLPTDTPSNTRRIECGCANPCPKRFFKSGNDKPTVTLKMFIFSPLEPFGRGGGVLGLASVESFLRSWPHPAPN